MMMSGSLMSDNSASQPCSHSSLANSFELYFQDKGKARGGGS
jgi:hypothetical protein